MEVGFSFLRLNCQWSARLKRWAGRGGRFPTSRSVCLLPPTADTQQNKDADDDNNNNRIRRSCATLCDRVVGSGGCAADGNKNENNYNHWRRGEEWDEAQQKCFGCLVRWWLVHKTPRYGGGGLVCPWPLVDCTYNAWTVVRSCLASSVVVIKHRSWI